MAVMVGLVALVVSDPVMAAGKSKHRLTSTAQLAFIEQGEGFPEVGSTAVLAGVLEATVDGDKTIRGADVNRTTITGGDLTTGLEYEGSVRWYFPRGSIKLTDTGKVTLQPDSSAAYAGEVKISGGTRAFRGATGKATYTGSSPTALGVGTFEVEGTISY